jgi:uncharacterized protein YqjF (DUF2071 family)
MLDPIDRISPTRRPAERAVMKQRWAELGFLHWKMPAAKLAALVPPALTIDTFDDTAWVGLVPFTMTGVRPVWSPPIPGVSRFHEVNVRTYVHKNGSDPGVWFFRLPPKLDETLLAAAGITRPADPPLVHYASEVRVDVFALRKV